MLRACRVFQKKELLSEGFEDTACESEMLRVLEAESQCASVGINDLYNKNRPLEAVQVLT